MDVLQSLQYTFQILNQKFQQMNEKFETFQAQQQLNGIYPEFAENLKADFDNHVSDFKKNMQFVDEVRNQLSEEVKQWERKVRLEDYDMVSAKNALEMIEKRFKNLWRIANYLTYHYNTVKRLFDKFPWLVKLNIDFTDLAKTIQRNLSKIINSSFLVVGQPQKVIKFGNKIVSSVQHLLGEELNLNELTPIVTMMAISAQDAYEFLSKGSISNHPCGNIKAFQTKLHLDKSSNKYLASFLNARLMGIQRNARRGEQSVTDEKFFFAFVTTLPIPGWQGEMTSVSIGIKILKCLLVFIERRFHFEEIKT